MSDYAQRQHAPAPQTGGNTRARGGNNRGGMVQRKSGVWSQGGALLQTKLQVGSAHDPAEAEADNAAKEVVSGKGSPNLVSSGGSAQAKPLVSRISRKVQRQEAGDEQEAQREANEEEAQAKCNDCEGKEEVQRVPDKEVADVMRMAEEEQALAKCDDCEKEEAQRLVDSPVNHRDGFTANQETSDRVAQRKQVGEQMPAALRSEMEQGFGADFSGVRIHRDSASAELNQDLKAKAFTTGDHVFFGAGQFDDQSQQGKELIAHELTHTIQQGAVEAAPVQEPAAKEQLSSSTASPATQIEGPIVGDQVDVKLPEAPASMPGSQPEAAVAEGDGGQESQEEASDVALEEGAAPVELDPSNVGDIGMGDELELPTDARHEAMGFVAGYKSELSAIMKVGGEMAQEGDKEQEDVCGLAAEKARRLGNNEASHPDPGAEANAAAEAEQQTSAFGMARANEKQMYSVGQVIQQIAMMQDGPMKEKVRKLLDAITPKTPEEIDTFNATPISGTMINAAMDYLSGVQSKAGGMSQEVEPEPVPDAVPLGDAPKSPLTQALELGKNALPEIPDGAAELKVYLEMMDKVLQQEGVDPAILGDSKVPEYKQIYELREQLRMKIEGAPAAAKQALEDERNGIKSDMDGEEAKVRGEMRGEREKQFGEARGHQSAAVRKREAQRAKITADVNGIHDTAKKTVEDKLKLLELHGKERFNKKVTEASIAMEANVKRRKEEWKNSEYEKRGIVGDIGLWWTDNMGGGLDTYPEVKKMYEEERNAYLDIIDAEIKAISDEGNKVVEECKTIILEGRKKVFEYLSKLKGDNEDLGRSLAKEISKKFDGLEDFVDKKKEELGQKLCQMRDAAVAKIDALIEKMHEESAGLLVKALNVGIDLLIAPFRFALGLFGYDMTAIDDVIRRVKRTFTFIISYPLEFAKRMIRGVGDGFSQFGKNIKSHLINTLVGWLTGALMDQPVVIPEKWNVSGILQFIGSLVGIGSEMVMGLIRNLLPEEVIQQAENLLPVFMRIPEEGPGALWEYIQSEAQSMKETAIAGVRDAVITQLVIIGIQKLMNVLTLGGSAFADAAKAIYDMILFFKNNWRKIVDLVTKIFNTLSAVADNDTKMVADGIENTMGRGLEIVFGFFMTSLGLGGVVNSVINVFRKIGDILRKAVTKAVDLVVGAVKGKLGGLFGKKNLGATKDTDTRNGIAKEDYKKPDPTEIIPLLNQAIIASEEIMDQNNSEEAVSRAIAPLKTKYRLKRIEVLEVTEDQIQVEAEINPKKRTKRKTVAPKYPNGMLVDRRSIAELWDDCHPTKTRLRGEKGGDAEKRSRIAKKRLLFEYSRRSSTQAEIVKLILKEDYGKSARLLFSCLHEKRYTNMAGRHSHIWERHVYGVGGEVNSLTDLALRATKGKTSPSATFIGQNRDTSAWKSLVAANSVVKSGMAIRHNSGNWIVLRENYIKGLRETVPDFGSAGDHEAVSRSGIDGTNVNREVPDVKMPAYAWPGGMGYWPLWKGDPRAPISIRFNDGLVNPVRRSATKIVTDGSKLGKGGWMILTSYPK